MTAFTLPIPTYQCHKRVQALRIKAVIPNPRGYELHFKDERFCPIEVSEAWVTNNAPYPGGYAVWHENDDYVSYLHSGAFESGYTLAETADGAVRQDASPATLSVQVAKLVESNDRVTWAVFLAKSPDAAPWDCHQVYSDTIEGRARYEAAVLEHFLGLGPEPDILSFDTDPPAEEVRPVGPATQAAVAADLARYGIDGLIEDQPPSGTLSDPDVAKRSAAAVFRDRPDYFGAEAQAAREVGK